MTGEWDSSEICEESRGADSAPSQQRDFSETLPAARGEKRPLPTTAPPPDADFAVDKRARLAEGVRISEDSFPTTPEKSSIHVQVSCERRKSSESGDWEEKSVVHAKVERVEDFTVEVPLTEAMPRESDSRVEDSNGQGLAEGEGVNVKEEKEEDTANVKEEHTADVKEEHGEFVCGGGIARVKEEQEEVGSDGGAVNVNVEHGGVEEGEDVDSPEEDDGDLKKGAMLILRTSGVVRKEEVASFALGFGIQVYNQRGDQVGCIEGPLGRYLRPLIATGTMQISAVLEPEDMGGGWELFRTETFERTEPTSPQRRLLKMGGARKVEKFDDYGELERNVQCAKRNLGLID